MSNSPLCCGLPDLPVMPSNFKKLLICFSSELRRKLNIRDFASMPTGKITVDLSRFGNLTNADLR